MTEQAEGQIPLPPVQAGTFTLVQKIADDGVRRDVWDEDPPTLWAVAEVPKPLGFPEMRAAEIPLREQIWTTAPPGIALVGIARAISAAGVPLKHSARRVRAVMMVAETWELYPPPDTTEEEWQEAFAFTEAPGVGAADHPWGAEAKTVFAVDVDGWQFTATRFRKDLQGRALAMSPGGGDLQATGRIPAGLRALLSALRGEPE